MGMNESVRRANAEMRLLRRGCQEHHVAGAKLRSRHSPKMLLERVSQHSQMACSAKPVIAAHGLPRNGERPHDNTDAVEPAIASALRAEACPDERPGPLRIIDCHCHAPG